MKLTITIKMDNAAFADDGNDGRSEAARLVEVVARKLNDGVDANGALVDLNGNRVGGWKIVGGAK